MNEYYVYAYLREDGVPYYIGKGKGPRMNLWHRAANVGLPPEERRVKLIDNITETEALAHEVWCIEVIGRLNKGTGPLVNKSRGGRYPQDFDRGPAYRKMMSEARSGIYPSEETKRRMSIAAKNRSEVTRERLRATATGRRMWTDPATGKRHWRRP